MSIFPLCDEQQYIYDTNEEIKSIPLKITYSMEFTKRFSAEELNHAINQCIRTADVFAAQCVRKDNSYYMEFLAYQKRDIPVFDFSTEEDYQNFCEQARATKINNRESLYYIFIYSIAGSYYHIDFSLNHLIFDGISVLLLSEKIQRVLNKDMEEISWYPYSTYLNRIENYRESKEYHNDALFWEERFLEISKCSYLFDDIIATKESTIREQAFQLSQESKEKLLGFCLNHHIQLQSLLATLLAQALSDKTGIRRFYFELPIGNRMGMNEKNSLGVYEIGPPFIFDFDRYPNLWDMLASVKGQSMEYYRHNQYDWINKLISEPYEKNYGKYIPQLSFSYFCMNKEPSVSFATLKHHHCETDFLPMTLYVSDYLDWRTINFHYVYWDGYFTEQEIVELYMKMGKQISDIINRTEF